MTNRKFHKTVITLEVLSEDPIPTWMEVENVLNECAEGGFVLANVGTKSEELNGKQAADALYDAGSQPEFFRLDDEGNSEDDED